MANHIGGQITIGAPYSDMRYARATQICARCLERAAPNYKPRVFMLLAKPAVIDGQCYVCERVARVAVIEANY